MMQHILQKCYTSPSIKLLQRESALEIKIQEEKGLFDFVVISNNGENTPENLNNMKLLTDLKNIIAKQLPKMPKEYIVRLVFDKHHQSMIIIKRNFIYNIIIVVVVSIYTNICVC